MADLLQTLSEDTGIPVYELVIDESLGGHLIDRLCDILFG
jgi:hypothetical protein